MCHFNVQETDLINAYRDLVAADLADGTLDNQKQKPNAGPNHGTKKLAKLPQNAPTIQGALVNGGSLNMTYLTEQLVLKTPYGRLTIPLADILRIDFRLRIPEEAALRIRVG